MTTPNRHRLRAAVVGCGTIGHHHMAHLSRSPSTELAAVCDRSPAAVRYAADRYSATATFDSMETMLDTCAPDVVHICTPPQTHPDLVTVAIEAGAHVMCEKPLAPTAAVADELLDRADAAGVILMESQNLRYNDPILAIDSLVAGGKLGDVRTVEISLSLDLTEGPFGDPNLSGPGVNLPGGAVHDFLPHLSYLFLHYAGRDHYAGSDGPVDAVAGWLANRSGNERVGFDSLDALVSAGRARGRLCVASDVAPDGLRVAVRGTEGSVETDLYQPYLRVQGGANTGARAPFEQLGSGLRLAGASFTNAASKVLQHGSYHGINRMLDALYSAIIDGRPAPISPSQIRSGAALTDALVALGHPATVGEAP